MITSQCQRSLHTKYNEISNIFMLFKKSSGRIIEKAKNYYKPLSSKKQALEFYTSHFKDLGHIPGIIGYLGPSQEVQNDM